MPSMERWTRVGSLALLSVGAGYAHAQATPTATAGLQLSAFGAASGVYTGVGLGKNLSITAGVDATFRPLFGIFPTLEVRGTYPVNRGDIDGQKNVLGGIALGKHIGRIQPYGDFLIGRGEIDFITPYPNPTDTIAYSQTASTVLSPGAGLNYFVSNHFALKADFQFEHYESPVTTSGAVYAKAFSLGIDYRLPLSGLRRQRHW